MHQRSPSDGYDSEEKQSPPPGPVLSRKGAVKSRAHCGAEAIGLSDDIINHLNTLSDSMAREDAWKSIMKAIGTQDGHNVMRRHFDAIFEDRQRRKRFDTKKVSTRKRFQSNVDLTFVDSKSKASKSKTTSLGHVALEKAVSAAMKKEIGPLLKLSKGKLLEQWVKPWPCTKCECIARIDGLLGVYQHFHRDVIALKEEMQRDVTRGHELERDIGLRIDRLFQMEGYDQQHIYNDFLHIQQVHMDEMGAITAGLRKKYKCTHCVNGVCQRSMHRVHMTEPLARGHLCMIHSFFLHSFVDPDEDIEARFNKMTDGTLGGILEDDEKSDEAPTAVNDDDDIPDSTGGCIAERGDIRWMNSSIQDLDPSKPSNELPIYDKLVDNMGIYRYQKSAGMPMELMKALSHLNPKYQNIKEEVLNNPYTPISADNWNQTLRKAKIFHNSFASKRIRTQSDGFYEDMLLEHREDWVKGEDCTLQDVVVLKLYTDFDKLQYELKKCFRWTEDSDIKHQLHESSDQFSKQKAVKNAVPANSQKGRPAINPLRGNNTRAPTHFKGQSSMMDVSALAMVSENFKGTQRQRGEHYEDLVKRLEAFYHWRLAVMVFIDKFSSLDHKKPVYFGVNERMILDPTPTLSYFGPVSTSKSYYVAKKFATAKGMVLEVSSMYPRVGMCKGFNASLMSDYPEEQEYLLGHIYMRIRKVGIRLKIDDYVNVATKVRLAFFAIHLFQRQIFSMDHHLEHLLDAFLCLQVFNCGSNNNHNARDLFAAVLEKDRNRFYQFLSTIFERKKKKQPLKVMPPGVIKMGDKEKERKNHLFYILIKKFQHFCAFPNLRQIVKIDCISEGLRPYFLDSIGRPYIDQQWIVSFDKVLFLYPNLKQIHFLNLYKFDDEALRRLIAAIKLKDCKLGSIKFVYHDFEGSVHCCKHFYNPDLLDKKLMKKLDDLKWKVSYPKKINGAKFVIKIQRRNFKH